MRTLLVVLVAASLASLLASAYAVYLFQDISRQQTIATQTTNSKLNTIEAEVQRLQSAAQAAAQEAEDAATTLSIAVANTEAQFNKRTAELSKEIVTVRSSIEAIGRISKQTGSKRAAPDPEPAEVIPTHTDLLWIFKVTAITEVPRTELLGEVKRLRKLAADAMQTANSLARTPGRSNSAASYRRQSFELERKANAVEAQANKPLFEISGLDSEGRKVTCHPNERLNLAVPEIMIGDILTVKGHREKMNMKELVIREADSTSS